ncbi:hypothetical protein [Gluconacetobacter aggeris]|uniref:hypothetical protein n=1 Tax=Gluconacetobacter aggeris TaxID=1286186 RepID=UPI001FE56780|nr:hypothetical protein [Gluconacetobacter aggeris]
MAATGAIATGPAAAGAVFTVLAALIVLTWGLRGDCVCVAVSALCAKAEEYIIPLMAVKANRTIFFRRRVRAVVGFIWRSPMNFSRILM